MRLLLFRLELGRTRSNLSQTDNELSHSETSLDPLGTA